jgi:hypothetical protein
VNISDPLFAHIGKTAHDLWKLGRVFFTSWDIVREYSREELECAELFRLRMHSVFEPCGEECGTEYDESTACAICGAGRKKVSDLVLNTRRIPKKKDFARSIADEIVVSERVAEVIRREGLTGAALHRVLHSGRKNDKLPTWYQLIVESRFLSLGRQTCAGIDLFDHDPDGEYRCPWGHVAGLNLLSELWVNRIEYEGADLSQTKELFGLRRGLLRPSPEPIISPRTHEAFTQAGLTGWKCEVEHLVNE